MLNSGGSLPVASMELTWNLSWLWAFSLAPLWFSLSLTLCLFVSGSQSVSGSCLTVDVPSLCCLSLLLPFSLPLCVSIFVGEKGSFLFPFLWDTKNKRIKAIYLHCLNESCWILTPPSSHVGRESNQAFRVEPQGSFCPLSLAPVEQGWVWFRSKGKLYPLIKERRVWACFPWKVAGAYASKTGASSSISEMECQDGDVLT